MDGDLQLLDGFDFNENGKLGSTLYVGYTAGLDRAGGAHTLDLPSFVPESSIAYPPGATHYKIVFGGVEIDFANETFVFDQASSGEIELGSQTEADLQLELNMTAGSTDDIFLILGIDFLQEVNGVMYPLKNGSFNPLSIVSIDEV